MRGSFRVRTSLVERHAKVFAPWCARCCTLVQCDGSAPARSASVRHEVQSHAQQDLPQESGGVPPDRLLHQQFPLGDGGEILQIEDAEALERGPRPAPYRDLVGRGRRIDTDRKRYPAAPPGIPVEGGEIQWRIGGDPAL